MKISNRQLIIETTNICDAHCVICPREQLQSKLQMMDMNLFKKIIDDAVQYDIESIDTCGFGEPFLDKYKWERFAYVREKLPKAKIFISTTAFHMDEDTWDDVIKYVDILKLSIYGVTEETYEAFHRGKVKYSVAMKNINGFLDYVKDKPVKPHSVGLLVATDLNWHEKDEWIKLWKPKLDEVMVWLPHNWVDGRSYRTVDYSNQVSCGRPMNAPLYIHANGIVSPCCWDINARIPLGDMNTQTIEEIYRGKPYYKLKKAHKEKNFGDYICKDCCQTNFNPDVMLYCSNSKRKVGQLTSNERMIYDEREKGVAPISKCDVGDSTFADNDFRSI